MITISKFKERIQGKFEGGNSMNLNWFNIAKEAGQAMIANISPKRLTRTAPLYGGVIGGVALYYAPTDIGAPSGLYSKLERLDYNYVPRTIFDEQVRNDPAKKIFTLAYVNGGTFIYINNVTSDNTGATLIDDMSNPASIVSSDMTLTLNTYDYLTSNASFMGLFTNPLNVIKGTILSGAIDLTDKMFGTAVINFSTLDPKNILSISLKLKTSNTDYYLLNATNAMSNLVEGYNFAKIKLAERVTVGTPVDTNINSYEIAIVPKVGTNQTIIIDNISIYATDLFNLSYVSKNIFIDKTTFARKSEPTDLGDNIEVMELEEEDIMVYEACRIVVQEGTNDNVNSNESARFDKELSRKYSLYFGKNPSEKQPLSYNQSDADSYFR